LTPERTASDPWRTRRPRDRLVAGAERKEDTMAGTYVLCIRFTVTAIEISLEPW